MAAVLLYALSLTSCALLDSTDDAVPDGFVSIGFEVSAFRPCDSEEVWWLAGPSDVYEELYGRYTEIVDGEYEEVYARLRGVRSTPGEYGHLGGFKREFRVTGIIEMRESAPSECGG